MSRATGDIVVGRRSVPPLDCGSVSAGKEPRRERPRLPPRSVTPSAAQGSFTSRFRVSVSGVDVGRQRRCLAAVARRVCVQDPARVFEPSKCSHDSPLSACNVDRKRAACTR